MADELAFLDPGSLADGDLTLVLAETRPAVPERGPAPMYVFSMLRLGTDVRMGELTLKIGALPDHVGHIGYRVFPEFRGNRYAARACTLIVPLARRHGIDPLWITCREENVASRRSAELAGAEFFGMVEMPEGYRDWIGPVRAKCKYRLATSEGNG